METQYELWVAIKGCMKAFGYQGEGKSVRIKGQARRASPPYMNAWRLMEHSGSAFFRDNFEIIIEAIRDRVVAEREERRKWRDRVDNPPPE